MPQMPLKSNWRQTQKLGQIISEQRRTRKKSGGPVREFLPQPVGSSEVGNLLLRRESCHLTTFWTITKHSDALQETRNPGGLGGGCALLSSHRP